MFLYDDVDEAKADLKELKEASAAGEHLVDTYDAASLTKNEKGKVKIVDKTEKPTQHGGWASLAAGAAIGVIFPPSLLVSGLVGAGAGALIGPLRGRMSNSDLREIGEKLDDSEDMQMETKSGQTILKGEIVDQPRLHGILDHIGAWGSS